MSPDHRHGPQREAQSREAALGSPTEGALPAGDSRSSLPQTDGDGLVHPDEGGRGRLTRIVGISGSLRAGSFNTALLRAAARLAPAGCEIVLESIAGIPLYDGDREAAEGIPPVVAALKDRIAAADGLLIATPEYNNSIPGVLKNAIDWLSRPAADIPRVFRGLPVALMGATPGAGGTALAQAAWLPILRTLGTAAWFGQRLAVSNASKVFDEERRIVDAAIRSRLERFVTGFVEFAARMSRSHTGAL